VKDLAQWIAAVVLGTRVSVNRDAPPNKRSYKVDIFCSGRLASDYIRRLQLEDSIAPLRDGLTATGFADKISATPATLRSNIISRIGVTDRARGGRRGRAAQP
jgi:hypothetical protein